MAGSVGPRARVSLLGGIRLDAESAALVAELLERSEIVVSDALMDVACSGGPDSTALAVLAVAAGRRVTLHHVDHGIRPTGSAEAAHVVALANLLGAEVVTHVVELGDGDGLEDRARRVRRAVLPAGSATGHTMDDQAETVLLNLLRGAGASGLAAMRRGAEHPLLDLRRVELRRLCASLGLATIEKAIETWRFGAMPSGIVCCLWPPKWPSAMSFPSWLERRISHGPMTNCCQPWLPSNSPILLMRARWLRHPALWLAEPCGPG